ncbi:DEAD/DEAH box helicase [Microvirga terrae]|uniref:DEAD/DEAH box helicase n=1 Tax=Microvirga terrae TaxID=2740529 RepID=A0ABY5RVQ6_9HYPH|nr:DEAD/DEAH box helicase [Microvirga terrae]UVF21350.1 DEAD/DEAH box helicase [Microvirga terrae]
MGSDGLSSFRETDVEIYLDEAMLLVECALIELEDDPDGEWRDGLKRAAEILEWLSQPRLQPRAAPLRLLSAAAYQLAGYPAMALGQLRNMPDGEQYSTILREYLRANFPAVLEAISIYWQQDRAREVAREIDESDLTIQAARHVVMCIGTICSYLRTGSDGVNERALQKIDRLAAGFLHSRDPYSYLLAKLTALASRRYITSSIWPLIDSLREVSSSAAGDALVQFARSAFVNRRSLVWPAQAAGIERLRSNTSFVLCTPTGSGKTTVATLGIVQGLFAEQRDTSIQLEGLGSGLEGLAPGNLVLYIVTSRALAAEVEARLAQDLKGIAAEPVVVTGLYGGTDWGPTDAWVQSDRATIVICTFEKADALIRYLGVMFLDRVRLVVIDEAHMVEQNESFRGGLQDGSSRAFRLEQLGSRLLRAREDYQFRIIGLSAVAARAAPALARWIGGDRHSLPTTSSYRSTRQMLGRLEVSPSGNYSIHYNLMDGHSLRFDDERGADTPYVRHPFPAPPGGIDATAGPEVRMRGPTLWAALQLAAERPDGSRPSVLISLTQQVEAFSSTCADLLESWPENSLPNFRNFNGADEAWTRCLASAADYFSTESVEYRLLSRGIAVHHGKMPALLARRLKVVIDKGYIRVVIATSTLSEGVNTPVNYLLIPSVHRSNTPLSLQEFTNLVGRAGRPGVSTEGIALVVLPERQMRRVGGGRVQPVYNREWAGYESLVSQIELTATATGEGLPQDQASSPLSLLLRSLEDAWSALTGSADQDAFQRWLEQTAVSPSSDGELPEAQAYLDTLDGFLIAAVQEIEELRLRHLEPELIEAELTRVWQKTYAFAAATEEDRLGRYWLARGRAIKQQYPDAAQRRRIYKTSLSPRSASSLLTIQDSLRSKLGEGSIYIRWSTEERLSFVADVLETLSHVPSFRISTKLGRRRNFTEWRKLLQWWLAKASLARGPRPNEITTWFDFVSQNFIYRGSWGLGSIIGLLLDSTDGSQPIKALEISDWPRSGLPWIAFWLKELLTWGTLDPVAAFLLARGDAIDRAGAEEAAQYYYAGLAADIDPNDALDPRAIRDWAQAQRVSTPELSAIRQFIIRARLERPAENYRKSQMTVAPIDVDEGLTWIDPAGYTVARSAKPSDWPRTPASYSFELDVADSTVVGEAYLRHV